MWLEHLLFGAVDDTSFAVSCKALPCTVKSLYVIRWCGAESHANEFFEIFFPRSRKTSDERRSNLVVVRSEDAKSDAEIGKKMKKKVL